MSYILLWQAMAKGGIIRKKNWDLKERIKMKRKIRSICDLLISLLFLISVMMGYYKNISHMSEYCFISGMLVSIIFIISFVYGICKNRALPTWLYFNCMISTIIIFIATITIRLNLEGAFWFIHIINPLLLFCYWSTFCNHLEVQNNWIIGTDIVFPICYFIFASILYRTVGICPFPISLVLIDSSSGQVILGIGLMILLFLLLGYGFHFLNRFLNRKRSR